jgi:hypothetical protein
MTVILDNGVVFHKGFGVDDAVSARAPALISAWCMTMVPSATWACGEI